MKSTASKIVTLGLGLGMSMSALAGQYVYDNEQYTLNIKKNTITSELCQLKDGDVVKDSCQKASAEIDALIERLEARLEESNKLLSDKEALIEKAKKLASTEDAPTFKDESSGKTYVMVSLTDGFNLPMDMEKVKADDFSLVVSALEANVGRYERALKYLESGKLPADKTTEKYSDISDMMELQNIVQFAKAI